MIRKSGYWKALKVFFSKLPPPALELGAPALREWVGALNQVQQVAIAIREKYQPISLRFVRLTGETDAFAIQLGEGLFEVVDGDRDMAHPWRLPFVRAAITGSGNDLDH